VQLADIGLREADLDHTGDLATRSRYPNPSPITCEDIGALLGDALRGRRPAA
jgi:hypothetical protein